mgnify:FL=1
MGIARFWSLFASYNHWHQTIFILVISKAASFGFLFMQSFLFPEAFKAYAAISISSSLIASILVIGWPFIIPISVSNSPKDLKGVFYGAVVFIFITSYIVAGLLDASNIMFLSILLSALPSVFVPLLYEKYSSKIAALIQALVILTLQPCIFFVVKYLDSSPLVNIPLFGQIGIIIFTFTISCFVLRNNLKLFTFQSLNIVVGQIIGVYVISKSVLDLDTFDSSLLWILIQISSVVLFITNSLSFKILSYLLKSDDAKRSNVESSYERIRLAASVYLFQLCFCSGLLLVSMNENSFYYFAYPLLNIGQGLVKVAGQIVLSLRKPLWQLKASSISFLVMASFVCLVGELDFEMSVQAVFLGVITSTIVMIMSCKSYLAKAKQVLIEVKRNELKE